MKPILFIVAIFFIYLFLMKINCDCSKDKNENFVDMLDFLSIIRNKKVEDIEKDPKIKKIISEVQDTIIKDRNNFENKRLSLEEAMKLKLQKSKSESNEKYKVVDESVFRDFSQLRVNSYDDLFVDNNKRVNLRDDSFGKLNDVYPKLEKKTDNNLIELEKLPKCEVPIKMDLIENNNFLTNSQDLISFDITKVGLNKGMFYNKMHNLTKISWAKSILSWYKTTADLELRFTFINPNDGKATHIIFPLFLVETQNIESFRDTYYDDEIPEFKTEFNESSDKISKSMKTGIIFPALQQNKVLFADTEEILDKNRILKNLDNLNNRISNQMKYGMLKSIVDTNLKNNVKIKNKNDEFYDSDEVEKTFSGIDVEKLDLSNIPISLDLNLLKERLEYLNFNDVIKDFPNIEYSLMEANSLTNLDNLLTDPNLIPEYICCNPSITSSKLITMDLYPVQLKILNQKRFYYTTTVDGSLALITQPYPYNITVGKEILEKLTKVNKIF